MFELHYSVDLSKLNDDDDDVNKTCLVFYKYRKQHTICTTRRDAHVWYKHVTHNSAVDSSVVMTNTT